jgi:hypothetical protein
MSEHIGIMNGVGVVPECLPRFDGATTGGQPRGGNHGGIAPTGFHNSFRRAISTNEYQVRNIEKTSHQYWLTWLYIRALSQ